MKLFCFFLLLVFSFPIHAQELQLFSPNLICKKSEGRKPYEYYAGVYIKNISKNEVTVITKTSKPSVSTRSGEVIGVYLSTRGITSVNDTPLIPSIVDFKLVTLRPDEATHVGGKFESQHLFSEAPIIYSIDDTYNGRFGFWSGITSIENVKVQRFEECNT
ncbi:hypothetical protein Q4561_11665 [Alteromonas sp. 1_MG-2023]|uniref:hypothetical protein n=1 Tax=Alteromonas sp. 1_MG-2023 TaxID=3062669 RepID=UPI0026E3D52E|nr:hypothetical protein [Alteromonas sp. 1_MG-2023]MDO6567717.1 hypothetical protein [Alteromonas sp. 1_MG-2023]